ncbi:MAG: hypothetical protein ACE147_00525 [Candidatus Methylomirabilales bacterium]
MTANAAEKALLTSLIRGGLELDAAVATLGQARAVYGASGR